MSNYPPEFIDALTHNAALNEIEKALELSGWKQIATELAGLAEQLANVHIGDRDELGTIAEKILKITNNMKD